MKMKIKILLFPLLFCSLAVADDFNNSISGYIFDKSSAEPLAGVNVYLSNTLWGSSTNVHGYYKIENIPQGTYALVVSMIGYKIKSENIFIKKDKNIKFNFKLDSFVYETDPIEVIAADSEDWYRNYVLFKKFFLGKTPFASKCIIRNEEVLEFTWDGARLKAWTKEPLIIVNNALGYEISCFVEDFYWDRNLNQWWWSSKNKFNDMEPKDEKEKLYWIKNREKSYKTSLQFFFSWLKNNQLDDGSYTLSLLYNLPSIIKEPREIYVTQDSTIIKPEIYPGEHIIFFQDYLKVKFKNSQDYSFIKLNYPKVILDKYGYPQEIKPFEVYGYWATQGMANNLPKYYDIE